jgi:hypothetical protein
MIDNRNQVHPVTYARKENLRFNDILSAIELKERTVQFLSELTRDLERNGCKLIGHIKGLIEASDKGHFIFSITSFNEDARYNGEMEDGIEGAILTVNVIVYGIEQKIIETLYQKTFNKHFG